MTEFVRDITPRDERIMDEAQKHPEAFLTGTEMGKNMAKFMLSHTNDRDLIVRTAVFDALNVMVNTSIDHGEIEAARHGAEYAASDLLHRIEQKIEVEV